MSEHTTEPRRVTLDAPLRTEVLAAASPETLDVENRTVDVVFYTGAPVLRYDRNTGQSYMLRFEMTDTAADLSDFNSGAPVLWMHDSHDQRGAVVDGTARLDGGVAKARLRYSRSEDGERLWQDVQDKIARRLSMGVDIFEVLISEMDDDGAALAMPLHTATKWKPYELSHGSTVADVNTDTLSAERPDRPAAGEPAASDAALVPIQEDIMSDKTALSQGNDEPRPAAPESKPEVKPEPVATQPADGQHLDNDIERARTARILGWAETMGVSVKLARTLVESGASLDDARTQIMEAAAKAADSFAISPHVSQPVVMISDEADNLGQAIEVAVLNRIQPGRHKVEGLAAEFTGMRLIDVGREYLRRHGLRHLGADMNQMALARAALSHRLHPTSGMTAQALAGYHTTSDFANILANVQGKLLLAAYAAMPRTFTGWARRGTLSDFKTAKRLRMGTVATLRKVAEGAPYKYITIGEDSEDISLDTYGEIMAISRQVIVNDDLQAMAQVPTEMGYAGAALEGDLVYALLTDNGNMADGTALFDAGALRGNVVASGAAPSVVEFGKMQILLGKQRARGSSTVRDGRYLNLTMSHLVVPVALELAAGQVFADTYVPTSAANAVPSTMRRLAENIHSDARLDASSAAIYYGFADPSFAPVVEYAYLDGIDGMVAEREDGFDVDGIKLKVRHDFGCAVIGFHGGVRNTGA